MPQLTYGNQAVAFAGMKADAGFDDIASYVQGESSAEIPFGIMVVQGTAGGTTGTPDKAILPVDANSVPVGVVVHSHDYALTDQIGTTGVKIKNMLSVMKRGRIWVLVEVAVAITDIPYFRYTASGGNTQLGAFRNDADTAKATKMRGAKFLTATSGAGLALLEIDIITNTFRGVTGY